MLTNSRILALWAALGPATLLHSASKPPKDSVAVLTELKVTPVYPASAIPTHSTGEITVKVSLSETGDVTQASVVSGDSMFAESAVNAARGWKFEPFYRGGRAIPVATQIHFKFSDEVPEKPEATNSATSTKAPVQIFLTSDEQNPTHCPKNVLAEKRMPDYPAKAKRSGVMGRVSAVLSIDESGSVTHVFPLSGPELLIPPTVDALKSWRYEPLVCNGKPTRVEHIVYATFSMGNQPQ